MTTRSMVRVELMRAFTGWRFLGALAIGLGLVVWHQLGDVSPVRGQEAMATFPDLNYPFSVYERWIGYRLWSSAGFAFLLLTPLLATLPHGASRQLDARSGYDVQLLTRDTQAHCVTAKTVAIFCSGVIVIAIPLVVDFIATAAQLPALAPISITFTFPIDAQTMWADLYYAHPLVYSIIYTIIYALWAGVMATTTAFAPRRISPLLTAAIPFLLFWILDWLFTIQGVAGVWVWLACRGGCEGRGLPMMGVPTQPI